MMNRPGGEWDSACPTLPVGVVRTTTSGSITAHTAGCFHPPRPQLFRFATAIGSPSLRATMPKRAVKEEPLVKEEPAEPSAKAEPSTQPEPRKRKQPELFKHEEPVAKKQLLHSHPTEQECRAVHRALAFLHPEVIERVREERKGGSKDGGGGGRRACVLDSLVGTILSQNTTDTNSHRAFGRLKEALPTWEAVRTAAPAVIEDAIRPGGLAAIKTGRIQAILEALHGERGECSLEHLRALPDDEVKAALRRYKGVGAKTISCVLMFCLDRHDFPVDTHVWKIALALGWVPKSADRDATYDHLNAIVPPEIKYELHVLLVQHGKDQKHGVTLLRQTLRQLEEGVEPKPEMVE